MNVAFVGAVEGSLAALKALIDAGETPGLVITLPDEVAHRHSDFAHLAPVARAAGSDVLTTSDINCSHVIARLRAFKTDLTLVVGWSQICREAFRSVARIGNVGFHPAPLPRLRGRAVIPWTILIGERETAATLFWLDEGTDSGPILAQEAIAVAQDETARSLYDKQLAALKRLLPDAVKSIRAGDPPRIAQDHRLATYCARRRPEDSAIDWRAPADAVLRLVRAVGEPYGGAFSMCKGVKLIVEAARPFAGSDHYIGLAGQVQAHTEDGFVVRCGDGQCVQVTQWMLGTDRTRPALHAKFCPVAP